MLFTRFFRGWISAMALTGAFAGSFLGLALAVAPGGPSNESVASCIRDTRCHRVFVVAHRANGFGAPENSREAVTQAIQAGVPLVKIDVRASKDGELYVLHDGWLDRTTNLRGRIEGVTSAELAGARLKNGETLPRFQELYE